MKNIRKIDNELYAALYGVPIRGDATLIWDSIKNNDELLAESIKMEKDKFGERDLVKGLTICDSILIDYKNINKEIYEKLVDLIYSNKDIARIVVDGYGNGGYSFLLMSLWNHELVLTDEQKAFAVSEAMNKIGTTYWKKKKEEFSNELDSCGINNDDTVVLEFGGSKNPIGAKAGMEHLHYTFASLSDSQAHGYGEFDIRYWILRNPNWTVEEKKRLVYDFYEDSEEYDECLEQWEWAIVNDPANYKGDSFPYLDKCELYYYVYDQLLNFYCSKEITDKIWEELEFCRLMHSLRPQQWELEHSSVKRIGTF